MSTSQRFGRDHVVGVLLNLEPGSPHANTVSLFRDGQRMSRPQAIPECLRGRPLCPHVCFRNVTVQVQYGPTPMAALPFTCRMVQGAAVADVVATPPSVPDGGKAQVLVPVAMPDEGTFDRLDAFLEENPGFVELSDRKLWEWIARSGVPVQQQKNTWNDKPLFSTGLQVLDELCIRRVIQAVAPLVPRNYVIMEVRGNLVKAERMELLRRFSPVNFHPVAQVFLGEPPESFKANARKLLLAKKQGRLELLHQFQQTGELGKAPTPQDGSQATATLSGCEVAAEPIPSAVAEGSEVAEAKAAEGGGGVATARAAAVASPVATLTDAEQRLWFRPLPIPDVAPEVLDRSFRHFVLPDLKEGFAEVKYEWQPEEASKTHFRKWVLTRKVMTRVEDVQPSEWFSRRIVEWQAAVKDWQGKQAVFRDQLAARERTKAVEREQRQRERRQARLEEQQWRRAAGVEDAMADLDKNDDVDSPADDLGAAERTDDIFSVKDICNIGAGEPIFAKFSAEDWALAGLRFEIVLLIDAVRRDTNDLDIPGIHKENFLFYHSRYFGRQQSLLSSFGIDTITGLVSLVADTVTMESKSMVLRPVLSTPDPYAELSIFVKLTEDCRRDRQRRLAVGDDTAKLTFSLRPFPVQLGGMPGPTPLGQQPQQFQQPGQQQPLWQPQPQPLWQPGSGFTDQGCQGGGMQGQQQAWSSSQSWRPQQQQQQQQDWQSDWQQQGSEWQQRQHWQPQPDWQQQQQKQQQPRPDWQQQQMPTHQPQSQPHGQYEQQGSQQQQQQLSEPGSPVQRQQGWHQQQDGETWT